ncbi:sensor histidine kinase [Arthrobacter sp. TMS1-12-1]
MSSIVDSRAPISRVPSISGDGAAGAERAVQQHDEVIQRLFAVGLRVQGLRRHTSDRESLDRIGLVSAELDAAIRELRHTIHSLRSVPLVAPTFSSSIVALVAATARVPALQPSVHLTGPLDAAIGPDVADHVQEVLREGLCNALRHAAAHSITITLEALPDRLELRITDDGSGFTEPPSCPGLTAMRRHAARCKGTLSIASTLGEGTHVLLIVPLNPR